MEDFILREIDRLGEMLLIIARKLGLQEDVMPDYSLLDVKDEFDKAVCPINLDALLEQENPVWYLVETEKISDHGLETVHSPSLRQALTASSSRSSPQPNHMRISTIFLT